MTRLVCFDDGRIGRLSIVWLEDTGNTDYVRFSLVDRPAGRSPN